MPGFPQQDGRIPPYALPAAAAVVLILSLVPGAAGSGDEQAPRGLSFNHMHTGKQLSVVYARDGAYLEPALEEINRFLADHYSGDIHRIDPSLLDLLHDVQREVGSRAPYEVISGYRSPETNARLRAEGRQVGRRSMHMKGKAIDIRLADVSSAVVRDTALKLRRGGVGYYEKNDFVHLDVGRVRRW